MKHSQTNLSTAIQEIQRGNLNSAKGLLKEFLLYSPNDPAALDLLSVIGLKENNFKASIKYSRLAHTIAPNCDTYLINLGTALIKTQRVKKAVSYYLKFTKRNPKNLKVLTELSNMFFDLKDFRRSIEILEKICVISPNNPHIYSKIGVAYQYAGQIPQAKAAYLQSIALGLPSADTHSNLGAIYLLEANSEKAILAYATAIDLEPSNQRAHRNLGHELVRTAKYQDAIAPLEKAISLNPYDIESCCDLANAFAAVGKPESSVRVCEQFLEKYPPQPALLTQYAFSLFVNKEYMKSALYSRKALEISPGNTSALAFLSAALNEQNKREEAAKYLDFDRLVETKIVSPGNKFSTLNTFNAALSESIYNHSTLKIDESNRSLSKGMCTTNIFDGYETTSLTCLKKNIYNFVDQYKSDRAIDPDHPFLFHHPKKFKVECWANVMDSGGFHDVHFHPSSWLSGVYYPSLPKTIRNEKYHGNEGFLELGKAYYQLQSLDDPPVFCIQPKEGLLVIFPSYIGHRTIPFKSEEKRICIAFDIIPLV